MRSRLGRYLAVLFPLQGSHSWHEKSFRSLSLPTARKRATQAADAERAKAGARRLSVIETIRLGQK
jgi:hypothetical protein